ncbi:MAG: transcriptional regulator [Bacteroidetes bacterium]|nr:MAG: transcriptional regulator [Bacteroidota bacterium]RLD41732.1 MAG: transcriptional regulator [Bacteroidota bacterium]RLD71857.1 MAG: transcriptional regulator [Bacteroidota bacterium]
MIKFPMVDLVGQYKKIKPEVDEAVLQVMETASFINGPAVKQFQENLQNYLGVKHVIPCANGTDALQVALMALGLQPGDEVITTSFTFIATAEVIALLRLTPVLVDVDPDTFNITPEAIEKAITQKTKAIIPVHLFGQCADMHPIIQLAKKHNLHVVEDTAQAIGADYSCSESGKTMKAGTIGDIGCTSFFPSKNLGAFGDGGAIFTNNDELAAQMRVVVNHGMAVRYYHDYVGVNSRLDSMQAAVLDIKLKHLDEYAEARQKAAAYYNKAFANNPKIKTPFTATYTSHVFHQYTLVLSDVDREGLMAHLADNGIASAVYYPVPLHMQKAYLDPRYKEGDFPVTEMLSKSVLSLPIHTELTEEIQQVITKAVLEFTGK